MATALELKREGWKPYIEARIDFDPYPEFKILFPKTYSFISLLEEHKYASMIQVLKDAFETDVINLLGNIPELRNLKHCGSDIKNYEACNERVDKIIEFFNTEAGISTWAACMFINQVIKGENIADALNKSILDNNLHAKGKDFTLYNSLATVNLFSMSIRSKEPGQIWISDEEFQTIATYLGSRFAGENSYHNIYSDQWNIPPDLPELFGLLTFCLLLLSDYLHCHLEHLL